MRYGHYKGYSVNVSELFVDEGLLVSSVGRDAAGCYQCFVSNAAGTVSAAATVTVTAREAQQRYFQRRQHQSDVQNIAPDGMYVFIPVLC